MEWYWWVLVLLSAILVLTIGPSVVHLCWYWWVLIVVAVVVIAYIKIKVLRQMMKMNKK